METWIDRPITLGSDLLESMTDEQFLQFCHDNPTVRFERTADHKILVNVPTGSESGRLSFRLGGKLNNWLEITKTGEAFDSSTGFKLSDGSIKSPDLAWISDSKWKAVPKELRKSFAPVCPDFVLELRSPSDNLKYLQSKMSEWIKNGVQLGFLIDPLEKISFVYRANGEVVKFDGFERTLSGEDVLPGFELDLRVLLD